MGRRENWGRRQLSGHGAEKQLELSYPCLPLESNIPSEKLFGALDCGFLPRPEFQVTLLLWGGQWEFLKPEGESMPTKNMVDPFDTLAKNTRKLRELFATALGLLDPQIC